MNKKELKKQYIAHCENTAPDMEKLWEKIESGLEEKSESGVTSKPTKTVNFHKIAAWCTACAAAVIVIIGADISKNSDSFTMSQNDAVAGDMITAAPAADGAFIEEPAAAKTNDIADDDFRTETATTASLPEMVYYEELSLAGTVISNIPFITADTFGDEFFVEEKVLAETDIIVDAVVDSVTERYYGNGEVTVCYILKAEDCDNNDMGEITIESASPYQLHKNREYILPLKETADGYRLVFENAPQIECTLDGGVIFHNGWQSLDENSCWVSYPRNSVDDFFYDRMRFSYTDGMASITKKWRELKESED